MEAHVRPGPALFRSVDDANEVIIQIEFSSAADARAARDKLVAFGVLDRFTNKSWPTVVEEAETVTR